MEILNADSLLQYVVVINTIHFPNFLYKTDQILYLQVHFWIISFISDQNKLTSKDQAVQRSESFSFYKNTWLMH